MLRFYFRTSPRADFRSPLRSPLAKGADVSARQRFDDGATDLHRAARDGDLSRVESLVRQGASMAAERKIGLHPGRLAALRRHARVHRCPEVRALLGEPR